MADTTKPNTAPKLTIRDGWVTGGFSESASGYITSLVVQQDGRLLIGGGDGGWVGLARYNGDGSPDTTFSGDGKLFMSMGASLGGATVVPQPDGKIVILRDTLPGFIIARFLANGDLDTSFGSYGTVTSAAFPGLFSGTKILLGNGKVLTAGHDSSATDDYSINRYNADGTFDTSFGTTGRVHIDIGASDDMASALVQPDGKILVSGQSAFGPPKKFDLFRLNPDGTLDTSFSGDGKVTIDTGATYSYLGYAMALQADGKVVIGAGTWTPDDMADITIIRYTAKGSLDTSFHGTGSVTLAAHAIGAKDISSISIQKDGKILALGNGHDANNTGYAFIARFLDNGTLDPTFGSQGIAHVAEPASQAGRLVLQPDGKILVIGGTTDGGSAFALMRLNKDGSVDQTFAPAKNMQTGTPTFMEGTSASPAKPVVLNNGIQVHDAELAATGYNGASLTLTRYGGANAEDVFSAKLAGTLSALKAGSDFSVDGITIGRVTANGSGTLTLAFGANATEALVNKAIQQIAYANLSDTPTAKVLIDWTFSDGNTGAQGTGGPIKAMDSTAVTIITANDAPLLHQAVPKQKALIDAAFYFVIPGSTFTDPDNDTLSYNVVGADGKALPAWLKFDAATRTLSGTPTRLDTGTLSIQVTAKDGSGATASSMFTLSVETPLNHVDGTAGADTLSGTAGNDLLQGFAGNDTLDGKAGADVMAGGDGNDLYYVDNAGDVLNETATGGTDTVYSTIAAYQLALNVEHARVLTSGAGDLTGNNLANTLYAGSGNNVLDGGAGNDTASYAYATAGVTVTLSTSQAQDTTGSGTDTLRNIENLVGSAFDDLLIGNQAANILNGVGGADFMSGGNGSDTYAVDSAGDIVLETNADAATGGIDTVNAAISYTLGANVENLVLAGVNPINGTGNALANKLTGNNGNNVLNGGAGADTMTGGLGSDTYYVDNAGDVVAESADSKGGTDTVVSTVTRTLGDYQENLTLAGTAAINGTGNALANKIVGNSAANTLVGGDGADTLVGGGGKDVLTGGSGSDVFVFNAASESGTTSATWDVISDLVRGQDKIDLRGIDANPATTANDAFTTFIAGTAAFTAAGQLKLVGGVLYGNTDADADAEFAIQVTGITQLTTADIML